MTARMLALPARFSPICTYLRTGSSGFRCRHRVVEPIALEKTSSTVLSTAGLTSGSVTRAKILRRGVPMMVAVFLAFDVHVAEDAADEDIRERRVVQREHHNAGEHALTPPQRHADAEKRGQQAVGRR